MTKKISREDNWWCSLSPEEKERIARKCAAKRVVQVSDPDTQCVYPECTDVWLSLSDDQKMKVFCHCVVDHGLVETLWEEKQKAFTD